LSKQKTKEDKTPGKMGVFEVLYDGPQYTLANIGILRISWPQDRFRATHTEQSKQALETTLKSLPLLNSIGVVRKGDDFEGIYGESRYVLLLNTKHETVECKVWNVPPEQALQMEIAENYARGGYDPIGLINILVKLQESKSMRQVDIAHLLGTTQSKVSKLFTLKEMPDEVKMLVATKRLDFETAYELSSVEDPELQVATAKALVASKMNLQSARDYIKHSVIEECDNCKQRHNTRAGRGYKDYIVAGETKWLCNKCAKEVGVTQAFDTGQAGTGETLPQPASISQVAQSAPAGKSAVKGEPEEGGEDEVVYLCTICKGEFPNVEITALQVCDKEMNKLNLMNKRLGEIVGKDLWKLSDEQIRTMRVVLGANQVK